MARYVDAEKLEKELHKNGLCTGVILGKHSGKCDLAEIIVSKQPTADVKEVVYGAWIRPLEFDMDIPMQCSFCHVKLLDTNFNFCPNCGADMRGKNDK